MNDEDLKSPDEAAGAAVVEAETEAEAPLRVPKTRRRVLTRRAVLWLGQTCNLRCYFCYFLNRIADAHHPEHPFMSLDKAKHICSTLRDYYGCNAIDIQGGEPTVYPHILELVRHCADIGLYPTLITNGLQLAKEGVLEQYREAGIRDFLVSFHGIGEVHDEVVGKTGAYEKMTAAIERMRELGIPFRFNCTMSKPVVPLLREVAQRAVDYGARVVNYIAFNPFEDQQAGIRTHENVPRYSDIKPVLAEAIDLLESAGIETNVRYLPLCMAEERHRKNFYNWQQLPYDLHEWDLNSWLWTGLQTQRMKDGGASPLYRMGPFDRKVYWGNPHELRDWHDKTWQGKWFFRMQRALGATLQYLRGKDAMIREEAQTRARDELHYRYDDACARCALQDICDGFHGDYADLFGTNEAEALTGRPPVHDPKWFIAHQEKVVETEDEDWAL